MLTDMKDNTTFFAPMIYLKQVAPTIEFYNNASDAIVLGQWNNDDGSAYSRNVHSWGYVSYA